VASRQNSMTNCYHSAEAILLYDNKTKAFLFCQSAQNILLAFFVNHLERRISAILGRKFSRFRIAVTSSWKSCDDSRCTGNVGPWRTSFTSLL